MIFSLRFVTFFFLLLVFISSQAQNKDPLAPQSKPEDALTKQLYGATLCTFSLEENILFYVKGMGMSLRGPVQVDKKTKELERKMWQIPADIDWELYILERPSLPSAVKIRLLLLNKATPSIHKSWNSLELGPFSLGFPNTKQASTDSLIRKLGFGAQAPMTVYQVSAADGSKYDVHETIFNGPDFVKGVGIFRGSGMPQLSPVDEKNRMGGPAYAAQVVKDSDKVLAFYTDILGLELRADREWTTSGALGAPAGTRYRFALVYAKGTTHGHLLFIDYRNQTPIDPGVQPRLPNRGLGMLTFPCKSLEEVRKRAEKAGLKTFSEIQKYISPLFGDKKSMTLLAPNGLLIELFEQ